MGRHHDLMRFYQLIDRLEVRCGGKRTLNDCSGLTGWPLRGVYFSLRMARGGVGQVTGRVWSVWAHML